MLANNTTRVSVAATATSVTGSDALTPKTSVLRILADALRRQYPVEHLHHRCVSATGCSGSIARIAAMAG